MPTAVPWPSGEALAALITQAGTAGREIYNEIRHSHIVIPAWLLGKKAKKGQPEPHPIEIPASLGIAAVAAAGLYWYFHSERNQAVSDALRDATGLDAASWEALYAGGPVGLAINLAVRGATTKVTTGLDTTTTLTGQKPVEKKAVADVGTPPYSASGVDAQGNGGGLDNFAHVQDAIDWLVQNGLVNRVVIKDATGKKIN